MLGTNIQIIPFGINKKKKFFVITWIGKNKVTNLAIQFLLIKNGA